ncbi:MAG: SRPBCC family protein [Gemmatimonadetes bacterium]|nr:SRPBCC family protein [Gemmatimonadota bacterium]
MAKKILIGVGALLALLLVVGFFLPKDITVSRSASIGAPPARVYELVATPRMWPQWSAWNARDPNMTITYSGPASGDGAGWSWVSKSQGDGMMKLMDAKPPTTIGFELTIAGMGPPSHGHFEFSPTGASTTVTWTMTSTMGFGPIGGWFALYFPSVLAKDFDAGLANLKKLAELPAAPEPAPRPGADGAAPGGSPAAKPGAAASPALGAAPEPAPRSKP